jgi:hypothetical protein
LKEFAVDAKGARVRIDQPRAGVDVAYLSPVSLAFKQTDGFNPPPSREFPNHWHVEAGTGEPRKELGMISVLVPYRAGKLPAWQATRGESDGRTVVEVVIEGRRHRIGLPRAGEEAVEVTLPSI